MTTTESTNRPQRTWFITGATSGIGEATVTAALNRGDNVAALGRNTSALDTMLAGHPDQLLVLKVDVRDEAAVTDAAQQTVARFGRIDAVAANAAVGIFSGIEEVTADQWRAIFDSNFFSTLNVLRATLPTLRAQKSGHILIGSAHYGQSAHPGVGAVAATKHALEGITDSLVEELAPLGVKVTTFEPGFTATQFLARLEMGANVSTDYDQTVRATYQAVGQMPAEAFNSSAAVASAIVEAVDADRPPRRLATGTASLDMIRASLQARLDELNAWAAVSAAVDTYAA